MMGIRCLATALALVLALPTNLTLNDRNIRDALMIPVPVRKPILNRYVYLSK